MPGLPREPRPALRPGPAVVVRRGPAAPGGRSRTWRWMARS
ncbi:hypothetical protein ACFFX0_07455 [Citricoccus parietis]|uniref:Uncharacterized protein n=1 Tax=Citricoccus parietis TaxID=592307 RepID=A0ABV5FWN2_9MICC